jgi:hypothetical protein
MIERVENSCMWNSFSVKRKEKYLHLSYYENMATNISSSTVSFKCL